MRPLVHLAKSLVAATLTLSLNATSGMADVVAVVSAKSSLTTLSRNQVTDIFLGKASRFPDGTPAVPIDLAEGSTARDEFYAAFTGKSAAQLKAHWSKIIFTGRGQPPKELSTSGEVKKFLSANPAAIGYIDKSALDANVKMVPIAP